MSVFPLDYKLILPVFIIREGFNSEELEINLQKLYPNESGILERFAFVRWYVEELVSLESTE